MSQPNLPFQYSGIVVTSRPDEFEACAQRLAELDGVEVHHFDVPGSRLVVVQETTSAKAQEDGLRHIQSIPGVVQADLVYHYVDLDGSTSGRPAA